MRDNNTIINKLPDTILLLMDKKVLSSFRTLRDQALEYAQTNHEFKNQTMNLEDSYGAAIYYNGSIIEKTLSSQEATKPKAYKGKVYYGHELAEKFLNDYQAGSGYSLVVVAGAFYAAWVEALHGLDVLTGAYQLTKEEVARIFKSMDTYYNKTSV